MIGIDLSALIAQDREVFTERGERSHSIGLAEGDSMPEENILMKPVVLAKNDPAIIGVFPHPRLRLNAIWLVGKQALDQTSYPISALFSIQSVKRRALGPWWFNTSGARPTTLLQIESKPAIEFIGSIVVVL